MVRTLDTGNQGEDEAVAFLQQRGYTIKARNWRFAKAEIDIVAENDEWVVIVEVKTRSADTFGNPEEFVTRGQQRHLIRAANAYLESFPTLKDVRFDIIAILLEPQFRIEHIPEAFYP